MPEQQKDGFNAQSFIDRLLAGPDDVRLTDDNYDFLDSWLRTHPLSLSTVQTEKRRDGGNSPTQENRKKLKCIFLFNKVSRERRSGTTPYQDSGIMEPLDNTKKDINELEKTTPKFDPLSNDWIKSKALSKQLNLTTGSLATYRANGLQTDDKRFGKDQDGRIWRRPGTPRSHPWYYRPSIK